MSWLEDVIKWNENAEESDFENKEQFEIYNLCLKITKAGCDEIEHPDWDRHCYKLDMGSEDCKSTWLLEEYLPREFKNEPLIDKVDWEWIFAMYEGCG
jgi:hypothetical protein